MIPMILQAEFAKALGQAISRRLPQNHKKEILCLDQVNCGNGDFIDIGRPLEGGIGQENPPWNELRLKKCCQSLL